MPPGKSVIVDTEGFRWAVCPDGGDDAPAVGNLSGTRSSPSTSSSAAIGDSEAVEQSEQNIGLIMAQPLRTGSSGRQRLARCREPPDDPAGMARKHDVAVVITNQIYTDIENEVLRASGGKWL
jgi:DNA repair protein RadB